MTTIKISHVIRATAKITGLAVPVLLGPSRFRHVVWPRQMAMLVAFALCGRSVMEIARRFGGKDHTTVLHAIKATRQRIARSRIASEEYEDIKSLATQMAEMPHLFRVAKEDRDVLSVPQRIDGRCKTKMPEREAMEHQLPPRRRPASTSSNSWQGGWPSTEDLPPRANVEPGNAIAKGAWPLLPQAHRQSS